MKHRIIPTMICDFICGAFLPVVNQPSSKSICDSYAVSPMIPEKLEDDTTHSIIYAVLAGIPPHGYTQRYFLSATFPTIVTSLCLATQI